MNTKLSKSECIKLAVVILCIGLLVIFFGFRKVNFHVDEVWNYGLANNVGSIVPSIDYGKEYSGMGPFQTYLTVQPGERFNYVNVWKNQADDVHPPLSYVFLHTICSLFPNTFSIWYGIGINLLWMAITIVLLYKLAKEIFRDEFTAFAFVLCYGTTVLFLDSVIFIRMYALFNMFAVSFAYLVKLYWDKPLDKKFYILSGLNLILGVFSHYYFLIYAFLVCGLFCINLIMRKEYKMLKTSIISFLGAGILYILLWYHILGHLFRGSRGKQAIGQAASLGGIKGIIGMFGLMDASVFSMLMTIFAVCTAIILFQKRKAKEAIWSYKFALGIAGIAYVIIVGKIAPFVTIRYIMAVGFAFMIVGFIVGLKVLQKKFSYLKSVKILLGLFLVLNILNYGARGFYLPDDHYNPSLNVVFDEVKDKKLVEYVSEDWEMMSFFKVLTSAKTYAFINEDNADEYMAKQNEEYVLVLREQDVDELFPDLNYDVITSYDTVAYYLVHPEK